MLRAAALACGLSVGWLSWAAGPIADQRPAVAQKEGKPAENKPQVEVCFVLDTTGSMGGLIEGAKAKIWSIANQIVRQKPTPAVKIALIGYRDRGDQYVTKRFDLTEDIDTVFANLQQFHADGGGDTPESVNQALNEAVNQIAWSADKGVLKIIFLVGDAPPHMGYDEKKYPEICKEAVKKDLIINAVQCGNIGATAPIWREIAKSSEGEFVAIGQTGNMTVVEAPQDKEIAELNVRLGKTLVPVATGGRSWDDASGEVFTKQRASEKASASVTADRGAYNYSGGRSVQVGKGGEIELLDGIANGSIKLADLKDDQLPPDMRKMTKEQREAYVSARQKERDEVRAKIAELNKARSAYLEEAQKKRVAAGAPKDAFDAKVSEIVDRQAEAKRK
jgi:hypothetical protein